MKFFVNLNDFVVRWIDDSKFSLNSLSSTSVKLILFSSKNQPFLTDWYENFRLSIANYKPMLERKIQVDLRRSTRVHSKSEFIFRKLHSNQMNNKEVEGVVRGEEEEGGERKEGGTIKDIRGKEEKVEHLYRSHSPFFSTLLLHSREEEDARREDLEGWRRESFECKNDYFGILGTQKEKPVKQEKKDNPDPTDILISFPITPTYSKFHYKEAKLSDETGYELILQKGRHKILRNYENKLKFKIFLHFQFFSPFIEDLLLNTPHFWNPALSYFQIKVKISDNEVILIEKRKKMGALYLPRFFAIKRKLERSKEKTIMQMKSVESNVDITWPYIKGSLKRFLMCLRRKNAVESEVKGFYWADNGGLLTEEQNSGMSLEYLKGFLELEQFFREKCIFEM